MSAPRRSTLASVNLFLILIAVPGVIYLIIRHLNTPHVAITPAPSTATKAAQPTLEYQTEPILISYGYFEKDAIQAANFDYFLATGTIAPLEQEMHWCFVISTPACGPCRALALKLTEPQSGPPGIGISTVQTGPKTTLLYRSENVGMDIALHNITMEYMLAIKKLWFYKFFVFINSSTKGPFYPAYMPPNWHWTHAYLTRMKGDIHAVASSLTCLPDVDAGGPGPRLESWAYAVDTLGLQVMLETGALDIRSCKLCSDDKGIVVGGEYGLTLSMLDAGFNIATLLTKYREGVDWRDRYHWNCNDNIHPSRHGTYDRIGFHPYETIFVKSSWHVADPYTKRYAKWRLSHLDGSDGTEGDFDPAMYHYSVSAEAQEPSDLESAYDVMKYRKFFTTPGVVKAAIIAGIKNKQKGTSQLGTLRKSNRSRTMRGGGMHTFVG